MNRVESRKSLDKKFSDQQRDVDTQDSVSTSSSTTSVVDELSQLRASLLGRLYINHIKTIPLARNLVIWLWRNCYPKYLHYRAFIFNRQNNRSKPLITLKEFAKTQETSVIKILNAEVIETPAPKVFPAKHRNLLVAPHDRYRFPEVFITTIKNATIYGGTNLTLVDSGVICHDLYNFKSDYTSEELHHRVIINHKKNSVRWMLQDKSPQNAPKVASFIDACAPNYAHWLTEVLPRIAVFCSVGELSEIPIVVNTGLHKNIMESLYLIAKNREIITLPIGAALIVDELYCTSVAGYVPFERRSKKVISNSHGLFSRQAFQMFKGQINSQRHALVKEGDLPRKIYIRRNSGIRKVTNSTQVERFLQAQGYTIVEPEKMNFLQQVQLFSHAEFVIGSSGAALANLIFCPKNAKIVILIGKYPDTSYWYWQNIACASGNVIRYIFGKITTTNVGIHADFEIDLDDLASALDGAD